MVKMRSNLIPVTATGRRSRRKMKATSITIHSTGNPKSTAWGEVSNLVNNNPMEQKSFHFAVDDHESVQALPIDECAKHAGDGAGPGNRTSIAIEICESGDRRQTLLNAVELCKILFFQTGLGPEDLFQHNHWSGKNCPRILRDPKFVKDGLDWNWFLAQFQVKEDSEVVEKGNFIINGKVIAMDRILNKNKNFVELTDLCEALKLSLSYDAGKKMPDIKTK